MPPARSDVDRETAKTLAAAIGVRAAARQLGIPEKTVLAWSHRFNWFPDAIPAAPKPPTVQQPPKLDENGLAVIAVTPSQSLQNVLNDDNRVTKIGLSRATRKAATTFSKKTGAAVIAEAQALRHVTAAAATLHGWNEKKDGGMTLNLGVVLGGMS